jgi:hypothetical protein
MKAWPFEHPDTGLAAVLADADPAVLGVLRSVDSGLRDFARAIGGASQGLTVDDYPGPPRKRKLSGYAETGDVAFTVELSRGDFFESLGRAPERFYVDAEVEVASDHGMQTVLALPVREAGTPAEAVAELADALHALRQEAVAERWRT